MPTTDTDTLPLFPGLPRAEPAQAADVESRVEREMRLCEFGRANDAAVWDRYRERRTRDRRDAAWAQARRVAEDDGRTVATRAAAKAARRLDLGTGATVRARRELGARGVDRATLELADEVIDAGWRAMRPDRGWELRNGAELLADAHLAAFVRELAATDLRLVTWLAPLAVECGVEWANERLRMVAHLRRCEREAEGRQPKPWSTTARREARARLRRTT